MTREEAIEHGKEQLDVFGGEHREFIEMAIKALEQEPCKWIPVESALPENGEDVLVYIERDAWRDSGVCIRKKCIDIGWQVHGGWHCNGCSNVVGIAWMPLPEPYQPESEE